MGKETSTYKDGTRFTVRLEDGTEGLIKVLETVFLPNGTEVLRTVPDGSLFFERKKGSKIWTAGTGSKLQKATFIGGGEQTEVPTPADTGKKKPRGQVRKSES